MIIKKIYHFSMDKQDKYTKQELNKEMTRLWREMKKVMNKLVCLDFQKKATRNYIRQNKELIKTKKELQKLKVDNEKKTRALTKLLGL